MFCSAFKISVRAHAQNSLIRSERKPSMGIVEESSGKKIFHGYLASNLMAKYPWKITDTRNRRSDNRISDTTNNYFTITPRACYYMEVICDEFPILLTTYASRRASCRAFTERHSLAQSLTREIN